MVSKTVLQTFMLCLTSITYIQVVTQEVLEHRRFWNQLCWSLLETGRKTSHDQDVKWLVRLYC